MTERSYTVVGAGAVGLLYGSRLARAGHPVRWLVRSGVEEIRRDGISVRTGGEVLHLSGRELQVATDAGDLEPSDVVLLATKTTAGVDVDRQVARACAPGGSVVVLQNGLGAEQRLRAAVPAARAVVGGLCFVCAHRLGPGRADHLDYGAVTLAPLDPERVDVAAAIAADLERSGVDSAVLADLGLARWRKLVWNIPFNGLCTVLDASTDALLADAGSRALVAELMDEVIAAARALGHAVSPELRDEMLATTDAMRPYDPSMKLDRAAGRPLEIGAIYDVAIRDARSAGAPMRRVEVLAAMLRFLDDARV